MIILTAGHTGPNSGAQCAATHFDEGAENIWLRDRIAEILTNKYGLVVLVDDDRAALKLLVKELNQTGRQEDVFDRPLCPTDTSPNLGEELDSLTALKNFPPELDNLTVLKNCPPELGGRTDERSKSRNKVYFDYALQGGRRRSQQRSQLRSSEGVCSLLTPHSSFLIDIHFNAHSNPNARGTEVIVADDATTLELRFASRLAHTTADALDIPLRCIKSESQTPHRRLGMLHLTPQSVILEVCFCTSPEDVEAYRNNREKLATELAWAIAELVTF